MDKRQRFDVIGNGEDGDGIVVVEGLAATVAARSLPGPAGDAVYRRDDGTFAVETRTRPAGQHRCVRIIRNAAVVGFSTWRTATIPPGRLAS
ncbi:MAG: hypothetical protein R3D67_03905 [Hyphomicrobiaceae bacterium]